MYCWDVSSRMESATSIIYFVSACLSLLGSLGTIVLFIISRDKKQQMNQYIFCLAITDFIGSIIIVVSDGVIEFAPQHNTKGFCVYMRAILNFAFVSSFFWTTSIAIHMYRAINHLPAYTVINVAYHGVSWVIPLMFAVAEVGDEMIVQIGNGAQWCHLKDPYPWYFWYGPMILAIVVNIILFFLVLYSFRLRKSGSQQRKTEIDTTRRLSLCLIAFILCWIFPIINHIVGEFKPSCKIYPLWVLQDFFAPLQGFLNFVVYGLSGRMARRRVMTYNDYNSHRHNEEQPMMHSFHSIQH